MLNGIIYLNSLQSSQGLNNLCAKDFLKIIDSSSIIQDIFRWAHSSDKLDTLVPGLGDFTKKTKTKNKKHSENEERCYINFSNPVDLQHGPSFIKYRSGHQQHARQHHWFTNIKSCPMCEKVFIILFIQKGFCEFSFQV